MWRAGGACWLGSLAGISGCSKCWRPRSVLHGGSIKYLSNYLHVRELQNRRAVGQRAGAGTGTWPVSVAML